MAENMELLIERNRLRIDIERKDIVLRELLKYNHIKNDLEAYLADMIAWGLGETDERPKLESFGVTVY